MRLRTPNLLPSLCLCFLGFLSPAVADTALRHAAEQGVFETGGANATLTSSPQDWSVDFNIPRGGVAGIWAKNGWTDTFPDHVHELRYQIELAEGTNLPVPLHWEVKGQGGVHNIPVILRDRRLDGTAIVDEPRIGVWSEVVLVISHPGGDDHLSGRIRVQVDLRQWTRAQILFASTGFRWLMLLAATLLACFFAGVTGLAPWARLRSKGLVRVFTNWTAYVTAAGCVAAILGTAATLPGRFPFTQALIVLAGGWLASHVTRIHTGRGATALETLGHAFIPGMLVVAASDLSIWTATGQWSDLARVTRLAAALFWVLYHAVHLATLSSRHRPLPASTGLQLVSIPFLFGVLLLLPNNDLMSQAGLLAWPGAPGAAWGLLAGRALTLLVFNLLATIACGCLPKTWRGALRALVVLPVAAIAVAASPMIADLGSGSLQVDNLWHPYLTLGGTMLSQGMLWAEVFLITGLLLAGLRRRRYEDIDFLGLPLQGFHNGMVFSGWFMGLLLAGHALLEHPGIAGLSGERPVVAWALFGGLLFPLAKTVMETFDGSPSFFRRLARNIQHPVLLLRGVLAGGFAAWACCRGFTAWGLEQRSLAGFVAGAAVYGGITLVSDILRALTGRGVLAGGRLYLVEGLLGGLAGAAIGFYFDASQTPVVLKNLRAYVSYGAEARLSDVYPLLSRWGYFELGHFTGGARLLWSQALAGVITWGVAAWLFAVNRSFLQALFQREWHPVRRLCTRDGISELADGTIVVLRWGLWMAPIIATFLRQMPHATWYNQDGALHTLVCIYQSSALSPDQFQSWSLKLFLWVLAFDAFRLLIWLDHMGLRVATLVNLSFIGMERLDIRLARFLGPDAAARFLPEGIKRFATWTPLLIPFYMPVGAAWDQVWEESRAIQASETPWIETVWNLPLFHGVMGALSILIAMMTSALVYGWWRHRRPVHRKPPVRLENRVYSLSYSPDGALVSEYLPAGLDLHRRAYSRRDPCGRALFVAEPDPVGGERWISWPVFGNYPAESGIQPVLTTDDQGLLLRHKNREIEVDIRITLAGQGTAAEEWKITVRNTGRRSRKLCLAPYLEWSINTPGADRSHTQYNRLFPEMSYDPARSAVLALHRGTRFCGFLAADRAPDGLHFGRIDFIGRAGTLWSPKALAEMHWRPPLAADPCPMFDSIAALGFHVELAAGCELPLRLWVGCGRGRKEAEDLLTRLQPPAEKSDTPPPRAAPTLIGHGQPVATPYAVFAEEGRVMRVLTPFTPRPFDHTLSNALGHVMAVTNRGLHTSSSWNAQQNRLTTDWADTVTRELPGEAIFLHDPAEGQWYSPTFEPLRQPDAKHEVEFRADGTAVFRMNRHSLATELTVFVPPDEPVGVYHLHIRNELLHPRRITCAPYFEMVLADMPENSGALRVEESTSGHGLLFENPRNTYRTGPAFVAVHPAPEDSLTRRGDFFSPSRSNAHPAWVEHGLVPKAGSHGDSQSVAAFRIQVEVPANGEVEVVIVLGQAGTRAEAERLIALYAQEGHATRQLDATRRWWNDFMARLEVRTSDPEFDGYLVWLRYQTLAERIWARKGFYQASGAFGFRDQLQDAVNLIWADPSLARRQILLHAAQQFVEGDTVHWFFLQQDGRTGFASRSHASDNLLWMGWAVGEYVRMTGDEAILDERVAYLDTEVPLPPLPEGKHGMGFFPLRSQCAEPLMGHVLRAIDLVLDRRMGCHGLPLIGTGDWNDGLDEIGSQGRGESVWLGFFLHVVLQRMLPLLEKRCPARRVQHYRMRLDYLSAAIETTWRDDRYLRAIHDDGTEIGLKGGGIWEIDALTASWAVFAGIHMERARIVFDTAISALEREQVILLGTPALNEKSKPYLGRSCKYPEGVRENGMYCHGVQWLVGAARLLAVDRQAAGELAAAAKYRDTALRLWRKISPLPHTTPGCIEVYGGQPNQQAADFLTTHDTGRMIWNGYTGAAGWMFRQAVEGVIGARLESGEVVLPDENSIACDALRVVKVACSSNTAPP